ncbi:class I SAM-dependent methyltransferase [Pseudaquabacterium pictum]|uniref:Methyltransferase type 11 domain-containing protein n=1 Tax=Pseudaquabacterium pictum TaxID=2315236 RepID=A0A480AUP8_9BURK|nr:class I SAM-dependent methyltransferase [Rubrivivax pictus]GCL63495.1 hypothetical protein AQPW35_25760 [Rubrivivax pictus]
MQDNNKATDFLEAIRLSELAQIEAILQATVPAGARVLEIGAGTGWQARELARRGYAVSAIDIPTSNHGKARIWPIIDFDGRHIPFPDAAFDIVYSSNVLEHVEDIATLNQEMARVLAAGGHAIHYVPTSAWRAWSLLAFYPALLRDVWRRLLRPRPTAPVAAGAPAAQPSGDAAPPRPLLAKVLRRVVPHAHGAQGTCFTELRRFSRAAWDRYFNDAGWALRSYRQNGMFLTGDMLLGAHLSTSRRQQLSPLLGCTAHLYVLQRQADRRKAQ